MLCGSENKQRRERNILQSQWDANLPCRSKLRAEQTRTRGLWTGPLGSSAKRKVSLRTNNKSVETFSPLSRSQAQSLNLWSVYCRTIQGEDLKLASQHVTSSGSALLRLSVFCLDWAIVQWGGNDGGNVGWLGNTQEKIGPVKWKATFVSWNWNWSKFFCFFFYHRWPT